MNLQYIIRRGSLSSFASEVGSNIVITTGETSGTNELSRSSQTPNWGSYDCVAAASPTRLRCWQAKQETEPGTILSSSRGSNPDHYSTCFKHMFSPAGAMATAEKPLQKLSGTTSVKAPWRLHTPVKVFCSHVSKMLPWRKWSTWAGPEDGKTVLQRPGYFPWAKILNPIPTATGNCFRHKSQKLDCPFHPQVT